MFRKLDQEKYLLELGTLKGYLEEELELVCQIMDSHDMGSAPEMPPITSLSVILEPGWQERIRAANLTFIPLDDSDVEAIRLLQFYSQLPFTANQDHLDDTVRFLLAINLLIPIGAFSLSTENDLFFKYVYSLSRFEAIKQEEFLETFLLWLFTLDSFSPLIAEVATGALDLESALTLLNE